jgi:hypothetical protein
MSPSSGSADTSRSDRRITTLAILKVNFDRNQSFIGNFLPFVYHCLAASDAPVVSAPDMQTAVAREFDFELPQAVLRRLLASAARAGKVTLESGAYVVNRKELEGCSLDSTRAEVRRGYRSVLDELMRYVLAEYALDWSEQHSDTLMTQYVDGFSSDVLAASLTGRAIPPVSSALSQDRYAVHRFVAHIAERDQTLFEFLEAVVKGRMLADALFYEVDGREPAGRLDALEVYLDGPLLLDILGYAGPEVRAPVAELIEMLRRRGAVLRCFTHSASEAQEILDVAASRVWTGSAPERFHGDVVSYLVKTGRTRSDIELMSSRLERDLLRAGIQTVGTPPRNIALQPDEERLDDMLQRRISYTNPVARRRDVDSLTAVHRLRNGRTFRDLADSVAVFVTRNYGVFRVSSEFFAVIGHQRRIPYCVDDASFTVLVWLHEPLSAPSLPRERIVADAYSALNPSDTLWRAYNDEIERLRAAGTLDDDDVRLLWLADESRRSLMDLTLGDVEAFTAGTVAQILERARETASAGVRSELEQERAARRRTGAEIQRSRERVSRISRASARAISLTVFLILVVAVILGTILGPVGPIHSHAVPGALQIVCAIIAVGFALFAIIRHGSLIGVRDGLRDRLHTRIEATMLRVLQVPAADDDSSGRVS